VGIDTPYRDVWIVVPAFNESSVIADVIADIRSVFTHVVCVDDGSRDETAAAALTAGAHVVRHPVNLGQGAAIQTGVEYARSRPGASIFATFDADGQHRVRDVVAMVDRLTAANLDIVIGTRFAGGPPARMPALKRFILRAAAMLSPTSRKLNLTDAHNGLRVFNRTVADGLNLTMNGMSHASEFISLIVDNGWRVSEEPVEILYTDYSMSKGQPLLNGVNIVFDGFLRGRMPRCCSICCARAPAPSPRPGSRSATCCL
jgi:polyprenyl-phospho-N-acetylgalactosaminyl synthase